MFSAEKKENRETERKLENLEEEKKRKIMFFGFFSKYGGMF